MNAHQIRKLLEQNNIFCHISTDLKFKGNFYPRIPMTISKNEDKTIDRICVAKTLEGAFTAIPDGGSRLENYLETEYIFRLFLIDLNKLKISPEYILDSEYLYESELVPDAQLTTEHWITTPFSVPKSDSFIIKINDWNEESCDLIPYHITTLAETEYDGEIYEAFEDFLGHSNFPCITLINNISFISENVSQGEIFTISNDSIEEYQLEDFKSQYPSIQFNLDYFDISIEAKDRNNINNILETIWNNKIGYF